MTLPPPPPRLFVITAAAADEAVVFWRGRKDWCHVLRWDLAHDTLDPGAWIKGRIYEEKCDLSPDGRLLLYFIGHYGRVAEGYSWALTGIGRLPWVSALALWPNGTTYGGGGRFVDNRSVILRAGMPLATHPNHPALGFSVQGGNAPLHGSSGEVAGAEWSGRDRHGELLYTRAGCLYRRSAQGRDRQVADLNGLEPDPQPAPTWATRPMKATPPPADHNAWQTRFD